MARSRREDRLTLNFDSLTDTVTNLSGTLILVVVLVLGITSGPRETSTTGNAATDALLSELEMLRLQLQDLDGDLKAVDQELTELGGRMEQLRTGAPVVCCSEQTLLMSLVVGAAPGVGPAPVPVAVSPEAFHLAQHVQLVVQESAEQLRELETRTPPLRQRLDELRKEIDQLRLPPKKPEPAEPAGPTSVLFRPPMEEYTTRRALVFSCRENTIDFIDLEVVNRELGRRVEARDPRTTHREPLAFDLPGSGSRVRGSIVGRRGSAEYEVEVIIEPKPGAKGETVEEIRRPGSRFQAALNAWSPRRRIASFGVWPDSYATFRHAREIAWKAGYDVGWEPMKTGEEMKLGEGLNRTY